jgi:N-acetylmuramoyl-L-alanine amidase
MNQDHHSNPGRRRWLLGSTALLGGSALGLSGCATSTPVPAPPATPGSGVPIDTSYTSRGQDSRVLFLILHYTVANFELSLKLLTEGEVSSHYLLSDESPPKVYRLVDEGRRAWHSGPSFWRGHGMLNASSIGIEIVNPGFIETPQGRQWVPFQQAQMDLLLPLVREIVQRHKIRPERILGHNEVLPQDKQDPGPLFPWKRLADEGLIPWPDAQRVAAQRALFEATPPSIGWWQDSLARHGYFVPRNGQWDEVMRNIVSSFQMRYRPANHRGEADAETAALLHVLITPLAAAQ